ncbi:MAG: ribosome small subunit-dependent GTPase A [Coriobacteriia bacterium]|jgi:ribosome biogenesis GTPase|nr:ribosome small subunit-dependent GTPase A [Coriobacteriia bacterium]
MLDLVPNENIHNSKTGASESSAYPRDLEALGFTPRFAAMFEPLDAEGFIPGRVSRMDRGLPLVLTSRGIMRAEAATHLREAADGPMAVGDWVALAIPEAHDTAIVEAILPRSSAFIRKDPGEHTIGQVMAANIDTIFIVQALAPGGPNLSRLERELVLAWESGATPAVVLTKADLVTDVQTMRDEVAAVALGVDIHVTSAVTGEGVDELHDHIEPGRTVAFFGASGVGKSTLLNSLMGAEIQQTAEVREYDGKGRHTTVAREMFFLPHGGILIDTPGMRALALWQAEEGMASAFPDIEQLAKGCRFADCTHTREPGCAVQAAVEADMLPARRLASYVRLKEELERVAASQDVRARAEKKRADKAAGREKKRFYKEHRQ